MAAPAFLRVSLPSYTFFLDAIKEAYNKKDPPPLALLKKNCKSGNPSRRKCFKFKVQRTAISPTGVYKVADVYVLGLRGEGTTGVVHLILE
jgi:hypothetical protein